MNINTRWHPWRISNGAQFAFFSRFDLAVQTIRARGWYRMETLGKRPNEWLVVDWEQS